MKNKIKQILFKLCGLPQNNRAMEDLRRSNEILSSFYRGYLLHIHGIISRDELDERSKVVLQIPGSVKYE